MGVINPLATLQLPARRPTEDVHGNKTFTDLGAVTAVIELGPPMRQTWRAHGDRYVQDGTLFAPRGSNITAGDEVQYSGVWFSIVGHPQGDMNHAFTGDDFGWVAYTLAGGG